MPHLDKVLAHAERQLGTGAGRRLGEQLPIYQRFLKIEEHRLRLRHRAGGGGREICQHRVELMDVLMRRLFESAWAADAPPQRLLRSTMPLSLIAIGGYGRGELNPFSDVDILFLHDAHGDRPPHELDDIIKQVLYLLWDVGFKVGHATRSVGGAIIHANEDNISKTSLLEARHLAGDERLFASFKARFFRDCVRGHEREYLDWRIEDQNSRHQKHGHSVFMQEPHIKNGPGGLRDYHNLLWSAYFQAGVNTTGQLAERRLLTESERRSIERAYDFLLRARTDLHYLNGRAGDVLTLYFQGQIANNFNYPQRNTLRRSEAFMKDYYRHARTIHLITDTAFDRLCRENQTPTGGSRLFRFFTRRKLQAVERFDGFHSREGLIYPDSRDVFKDDPFRLLRVFAHAQERNLSLSPELSQLIRRRLHLVNRTFTYARAAREIFLQLLSRKGKVGRILRAMHEVDLLGRYLPEFGGLTCLVQHEFSHRYTADEHTLVCIDKLDALAEAPPSAPEEPAPAGQRVPREASEDYRQLFDQFEDPFVLYLAMLLHDTGKATSARQHAEASALFAQKVAARLQLSPERRRMLILLVDHHLTLSATAQSRNLDDRGTIAEFAAIVKNRPTLDGLMLLTLADGQGTSDEGWSDWKESLVWHLYRATARYLSDGEAVYKLGQQHRDELRKTVAAKLGEDYADELEAHFELMPERYFSAFDATAITGHLSLFRRFIAQEMDASTPTEALSPALQWTTRAQRGHTEVSIGGWQRRDLLAKIAGSFSSARLNILSADSFLRGDQLSLNVFRVCDSRLRVVSDPRDIVLVEKSLASALAVENFDFHPLLQKALKRQAPWHANGRIDGRMREAVNFPTRIMIRNDLATRYTLLEIQTADRLGLLYDLLHALGLLDVQVALARIATEKGAAIDSFYLLDAAGVRITDHSMLARLRAAIQKAALEGK